MSRRALLDNVLGVHEWGYRDLVVGGFIADDAPFRMAEQLASGEWCLIDSGVVVEFFALHLDGNPDPTLNKGWHRHLWKITVWRDGEPWTDGRSPLGALQTAVDDMAPLNEAGERVLPPELWTNEAIARRVSVLANVTEVHVEHEGFVVRLRR